MYVMLPLIQWNLSDRIFFGRTGVLIRGGLLYIEFDLILTRLHCVLFYAVGVLSVWPLSKVWYQWFTLILVFFSLYPSPPPPPINLTGIVWKKNDPHLFFSSGKDCAVYQHVFRDATRPADKANPVGIDINITGSLAYTAHDKLGNNGTGIADLYSMS